MEFFNLSSYVICKGSASVQETFMHWKARDSPFWMIFMEFLHLGQIGAGKNLRVGTNRSGWSILASQYLSLSIIFWILAFSLSMFTDRCNPVEIMVEKNSSNVILWSSSCRLDSLILLSALLLGFSTSPSGSLEWLCSFSWRWIESGSCKSLKFCLLRLWRRQRKDKDWNIPLLWISEHFAWRFLP